MNFSTFRIRKKRKYGKPNRENVENRKIPNNSRHFAFVWNEKKTARKLCIKTIMFRLCSKSTALFYILRERTRERERENLREREKEEHDFPHKHSKSNKRATQRSFFYFFNSFRRCFFFKFNVADNNVTAFCRKPEKKRQRENKICTEIFSQKYCRRLPVEICCKLSTTTGRSWPEVVVDSCFSRNSAARSKASTPHDSDVMALFYFFSLSPRREKKHFFPL